MLTAAARMAPIVHQQGRYAKWIKEDETYFSCEFFNVCERKKVFPTSESDCVCARRPHTVLKLAAVRESFLF